MLSLGHVPKPFLSNHPPFHHPLQHPPNAKRKGKSKRMTLVIGALCANGMVFCSDTEEGTVGGGKRDVRKLFDYCGDRWSHMGGMKAFFEAMSPTNFWDTDNEEEKEFGDGSNGGYSEDDWNFYKGLRDGKPESNPKRLTLYSGNQGQYYNKGETPDSNGDGLHILAPTSELLLAGNECGDFNDCSYVILYRTGNHKILFAGDSHDETWEHILDKHQSSVTDVDLLIAPHHGRDSERDWEFLDVVNPALTLFGNADSEHLAYSAWNNRSLPFITNNQAGCVMIDAETDPMYVYVTCESFAKASNPLTFYAEYLRGYYWGAIVHRKAVAV
jgi:competence protein ComEC